MIDKIKEDFGEKMMYLYADRDAYSRGKIIELSKEYLTEVIDKNLNLGSVIASNWVKVEDGLPLIKRKYLVAIDQGGGVISETHSTFFPKKNKFHFDMAHLNWRVVAWADTIPYSL